MKRTFEISDMEKDSIGNSGVRMNIDNYKNSPIGDRDLIRELKNVLYIYNRSKTKV